MHDLVRQRAEIAEHAAEHHAHQQRGKAERGSPGGDLEHGERHREEHKGNAHGDAVAVGVEDRLQPGEHQPRQRAEDQRAEDLQQRVDQHGVDIHDSAAQRPRDAEGDGEHDQAHRVVERDDRQQQIGQLALGLVLAHDHQCGGRRGRRGDGAQRDGRGDRERRGEQEVHAQQCQIDQQRRHHGLQHADDQCLPPRLAQLRETELVADGKGDKAQRDIRDGAERPQLLKAVEAQTRDPQRAEKARPDQHPGHQIGRHVRQTELVAQTRQHQTYEYGHGNIQQFMQNRASLFLINFTACAL